MKRRGERVAGVDVARALASVIMIQGHAYHGWVAEEYWEEPAYLATRLLGTLPLPAFLVLAGASLGLAVLGAARAGHNATALRQRLVRRGLGIIAVGYAVSIVYGVMDGATRLETYLRADVLHVIGLSLAIVAFVGVRGGPRACIDPRALFRASIATAILATLLSPAIQPLGEVVDGAARFPIALFVDVPGVTKMPFFPLASWLCVGVVVAFAFDRSRRNAPRSMTSSANIAGASPRFLSALAAVSFATAFTAHLATEYVASTSALPFTRGHPAIALNVIDLAARGLFVLAVGASMALVLPPRLRAWVTVVGRGSLLAYVIHVPFCYGRLGRGLVGSLDMTQASVALLPLLVLSIGVVLAYERLRAWHHREGVYGVPRQPARDRS